MAEVGFLAFARTAWEVGRAVLPPYRTRFSKHQFTQPQLLAILCLMRYVEVLLVRDKSPVEIWLTPGFARAFTPIPELADSLKTLAPAAR
jgi:hypothetical protein